MSLRRRLPRKDRKDRKKSPGRCKDLLLLLHHRRDGDENHKVISSNGAVKKGWDIRKLLRKSAVAFALAAVMFNFFIAANVIRDFMLHDEEERAIHQYFHNKITPNIPKGLTKQEKEEFLNKLRLPVKNSKAPSGFEQIGNYKAVDSITKDLKRQKEIIENVVSSSEAFRLSYRSFELAVESPPGNLNDDATKRLIACKEVINIAKSMENKDAAILAINYFVNSILAYDDEKLDIYEKGSIPHECFDNSLLLTIQKGMGTCADIALLKKFLIDKAGLGDRVYHFSVFVKESKSLHAVLVAEFSNGTKVVLDSMLAINSGEGPASSCEWADSVFGKEGKYVLVAIVNKREGTYTLYMKIPEDGENVAKDEKNFARINLEDLLFSPKDQRRFNKIKELINKIKELIPKLRDHETKKPLTPSSSISNKNPPSPTASPK